MIKALLAATTLLFGMGTASQPEAPPTSLRLSGTGLKSITLSAAELAAMPRRVITVTEKEGAEAKYEGVTVQDLLSAAGMSFGQSLRGPRLRDYLLAEAADGYGVIFALPEISLEFSDRVIIVADKINGGPITGRDGPLRVIVSDEKKHARWVRNVASLTVQTPEKPAPAAK